jgi:hypothetical protein
MCKPPDYLLSTMKTATEPYSVCCIGTSLECIVAALLVAILVTRIYANPIRSCSDQYLSPGRCDIRS